MALTPPGFYARRRMAAGMAGQYKLIWQAIFVMALTEAASGGFFCHSAAIKEKKVCHCLALAKQMWLTRGCRGIWIRVWDKKKKLAVFLVNLICAESRLIFIYLFQWTTVFLC